MLLQVNGIKETLSFTFIAGTGFGLILGVSAMILLTKVSKKDP